MNNRFYVRVWGKCAHFLMPEGKVDGFTYPFLTPSAGKGLLEAIYYKPEFYIDIRTIRVLNPVKYNRMKSNYLPERPVAGRRMDREKEKINQVASVVLEDVDYVIGFDIRLCRREHGVLVGFDVDPHDDNNVIKHREVFRRRVKKGQFFRHPFLGTSKYLADFGPGHGNEATSGESLLAGSMLHGIEHSRWDAVPHFFHAHMDAGVVEVPSFFDILKERAS